MEMPGRGRFNEADRRALRGPARGHHLYYIARELPARIAAHVGTLAPQPGCDVLDYGCADLPYRSLFPAECRYLGADLPGNPRADLEIAPNGTVTAPDESFDFIVSTQVLEHVERPDVYLAECRRLLRPQGRLLLSTHGMMLYHPDPVDLWRWTCEGLRWQVRAAGLNVVSFEGIMGPAATGLQLVQDAMIQPLPTAAQRLVAFVMQALVALADRVQSQQQRDLNALVFMLTAERA
jgi:SAM-dependent methyltransferase